MASSERTKLCDEASKPARARLVSVEPVYFLLVVTQGAITTARVQYVEKRLAEDYNYTLIGPQKENCSFDTETSDPVGLRIKSETALWVMWMSSLSTIIPIFTGSLLVVASDVVGRKPILLVSATSHLISAAILIVVAMFDLPLAFMLVSKTILGIFGDLSMPGAVCLTYIADSTTLETRAVKIAALDFSSNFGWGLGKLLVSVILQETYNFTLAFGFSTLVAALCVFYTACPGLLLETMSGNQSSKGNVGDIFKTSCVRLRSLCSPSWGSLRWRIIALCMTMALIYLVKKGIFTVVIIIGLGEPFCWQPLLVGIFEIVAFLVPGTGK